MTQKYGAAKKPWKFRATLLQTSLSHFNKLFISLQQVRYLASKSSLSHKNGSITNSVGNSRYAPPLLPEGGEIVKWHRSISGRGYPCFSNIPGDTKYLKVHIEYLKVQADASLLQLLLPLYLCFACICLNSHIIGIILLCYDLHLQIH
jgi:hypothetical protein